MKAVEQIWATKPETAGRVRGRIESILDWATPRGYRVGENPARCAVISTIYRRQKPRSGASNTTRRSPIPRSRH
ncbi:MAG: phage integrase central domain-containing protein [Bradyrhizobium sp.]